MITFLREDPIDNKTTTGLRIFSIVPIGDMGKIVSFLDNNAEDQKVFYKEDLKSKSDYYCNVFNSIDDGVSVLNRDYVIEDINFTMEKWFVERNKIIGLKCYEALHNRATPCDGCPIKRTFETGEMHTEVVHYKTMDNGTAGWKEVKGYPIFDNGEVVGVVEHVKDVTYDMDLFSKVAIIEKEIAELKVHNDLLKKIISRLESERNILESNISLNIQNLVKPAINEIKRGMDANSTYRHMMVFLESLIEKIVEPYTSNAPNGLNSFTTREIEVLQLIRQGKSSKEIATVLFVTPKTVAFHRGNIRKKLGLDKCDNLRAYLLKNPIAIE